VFVHISAVERAGLGTLREGQNVSYEIVADRRSGKVFGRQSARRRLRDFSGSAEKSSFEM